MLQRIKSALPLGRTKNVLVSWGVGYHPLCGHDCATYGKASASDFQMVNHLRTDKVGLLVQQEMMRPHQTAKKNLDLPTWNIWRIIVCGVRTGSIDGSTCEGGRFVHILATQNILELSYLRLVLKVEVKQTYNPSTVERNAVVQSFVLSSPVTVGIGMSEINEDCDIGPNLHSES